MSQPNEAILRAAVELFNDQGMRERYLDMYAPDVILHGYPQGLVGFDGARQFYSELWSSFPDAQLAVEEVIERGDQLAVRYTLSGVQTADFFGAPSDGGSRKFEGIAWLRFRDGHAVEVWQASGTLDLLTRLTALAAEGRTRRSASAEAAALRWEERQADADD